MGFFTNLFRKASVKQDLLSPSTYTLSPNEKTKPNFVAKGWKTGMWVMDADKIGILTSLNYTCDVQYTDPFTGEDTVLVQVSFSNLRQARYGEIPEKRRNISQEKALELGYGP